MKQADSARSAQCFHCALPLSTNAAEVHWVELDGEQRPMCCRGCALAAQLLHRGGWTQFYRYRTANALQADNTLMGHPDAFAEFDNDDIQQAFVTHASDGRTARLSIGGMSCAACSWLLEHYLKARPGVTAVTVHLAERRLTVSWDNTRIRLSEIMAAIAQLGYAPRPYMPATEYVAMRAESRTQLQRLGVAGLLMMQIGMLALAMYLGAADASQYSQYFRWVSLLLAIPLVLYCARPFFVQAFNGLRHFAPGMDFPVALAIAFAFVFSVIATVSGEGEIYFDTIAMFCFFLLLGRFVEQRVRRSLSLASLNLQAQIPVLAQRGDDMVPVERLRSGDQVLVKANEIFPCDGTVVSGASAVNEASFTGESAPRQISAGDSVSAGTCNIDQPVTVCVAAVGIHSRLARLMRLVDRASEEKSAVEQMADWLARRFVLFVLFCALATGLYWYWHDTAQLLPTVIAVLIVSCPCALSLATPVAITAASQWLKARGFLMTRGHALEALAQCDTVIFDKTGTLTTGDIQLAATTVYGDEDSNTCVAIATAMEAFSEHPIANAFRAQGIATVDTLSAVDFRRFNGGGIAAVVNGQQYFLGSARFLTETTAVDCQQFQGKHRNAKAIYLSRQHELLARFTLHDTIRSDAASMIHAIQRLGIRTVLLSGDNEAEVARVSDELAIDEALDSQSADDKLQYLQRLQQQGRVVLAVGDGINDIPLLAAATVSVAVANATDLAKAKADCFLPGSDIGIIARALVFARSARRTIRQNIAWALGYNLVALPCAAMGIVQPWMAAIGMSASSLLVVGNAMRLRYHIDDDAGRSSPTGQDFVINSHASATGNG